MMKKIFASFLTILVLIILLSFKHSESCIPVDYVKIDSKIILSAEKKQGDHMVWGYYFFTDKAKKQVLVINVGCCMSPVNIYIFYKDQIPPRLIKHYEFHYRHNQISKEPLSYIKERIKNATILKEEFFITKKGIKLGTSYKDIINTYGVPDKIEIIRRNPRVVKYHWYVLGKEEAKSIPEVIKEKVCPELEFGYESYIEFVEGKASVIYFYYEQP